MDTNKRFSRRSELSGPACTCIALASVLVMLVSVIAANVYFGLPLY